METNVEILQLAIAREMAAYRLFMRFSKQVRDHQMREVFEQIAGEELEHKARLELELMKLGVVVPSPKQGADDEQGQDEDENDISAAGAEIDYKDMLIFAMKKERKSLRLYIDLAGMAKDEASRELLVALAENEAMHQARFEVEYNILMRKRSE